MMITDAPAREKCEFHGYTRDTVEDAVKPINAELTFIKFE
jgi:hypothetical protein